MQTLITKSTQFGCFFILIPTFITYCFLYFYFHRKARRAAKEARMLAYQADQGMPSMHTECHDTTVWNFMISEETFNISFSKCYQTISFGFFFSLLLKSLGSNKSL